MKTYYIFKGTVTSLDAYEPAFGEVPKIGDDEYQFSDDDQNRSISYDFLTLEAGLAALGPAIFHWVG